jgi:predicted transposase YbfD/YdcC
VIKVKANQPKLYQQIQQHTQQQEPSQSQTSKEKTRGRQSERIVKVFAPPADLDPKWSGVGCVISVERKGMRGDVAYERIGFYISSLDPNNQRIAKGIRQHWGIENRLHWVKDVVYEEDSSPQKAGFAPINLSLLKTWVLTLMRLHGFDSLTESISTLSHNIKQILSFCF